MDANKKHKKKVLLYYLILAACLLIIAAVTVTVVLTVGRNSVDPTGELPSTNKPDDNKKPDDGKNPDDDKKPDDDKPTGTDTDYLLPLDKGDVICGYEFAYDKTLDRYCVHQGMDFAAKAGDKVYATLDGTVTKVVKDHVLNENYISIKHKDGVTATYKYIVAKDGLKEGDSVKRGDIIGTVATAAGMEMNDGEHLHFELKANGKTVDPDEYLDITEK